MVDIRGNCSYFINQEAETVIRSHGTYNFERPMSNSAVPLVSPMAFIVVLQTQDWFFQSLWRNYRFKPIHCLLTTTTTLLCPFLGSEDASAGLLSLWPLPSIPPIHSPRCCQSSLSKIQTYILFVLLKLILIQALSIKFKSLRSTFHCLISKYPFSYACCHTVCYGHGCSLPS